MHVSVSITDVQVAISSSTAYHHRPSSSSSCFKHFHSSFPSTFKSYGSFYIGKHATGLDKIKSMGFTVKASDNSRENLAPIAPLNPESPPGQLLTQILQTRPHLFPAATDQQLENLQEDKNAQKEETPTSSQDLLLYRRIAEVREKDRRKALEEIIYCVIVQKFIENDISLTPKIFSGSDTSGWVDFWPDQEQKLESVHSPEAFEMIQSHVSIVLGDRLVGPLQSVVEISKVKLGKLYAASIMYGYFLRRVDRRYQLERAMKTLPEDFDRSPVKFQDPGPQNPLWDSYSSIQIPAEDDGGSSYGDPIDAGDGKSYKLRSYVMYLDAETLQRYATIRSKEAMSLIEKQTQALFGRPDIRVSDTGSLETQNDEILSLTFAGLTMLVLEAVTFGSFLWDAEDYVESKYGFVNN